ncbi:MAG: dolichol kinase [Candidatus Verstraetearchaeota archaeon]|nr:dolichol kinase [Candidatus Verstraetearchaeota archaeon]
MEVVFNAAPLHEMAIALAMLAYLMFIVYSTKWVYSALRKRGVEHNVSVYYNRKIIHIFGAGVLTLLFPVYFTGIAIPMLLVGIIAILIYIPHRTGKILYWFQMKENAYEVNFTIAWGFAIGFSWLIFGDPVYGVVTAAFMAFGDAVTGVVRNAMFKRRTKHWLGNVAMLAVSLPIGAVYAGTAGMVAALVASIVEHFELNPIDDNILITLGSLITLIILREFLGL